MEISDRHEDIAEARALLDLAPTIPSLWMDLANALEQAECFQEAADAWKMVLALVPQSDPAREGLERVERLMVDQSNQPEPDSHKGSEPELRSPAVESRQDPFDLDELISDLQSGREAPSPKFDADEVEATRESKDDGQIATRTLAEIYESQGLLFEAAAIFDQLADRAEDESEAEILHARARDLRSQSTRS